MKNTGRKIREYCDTIILLFNSYTGKRKVKFSGFNYTC